MNIKCCVLLLLILSGVNMKMSAQAVSYNKRAMGSVGKVPSVGDFMNSASLDNVDMSTGTLKVGIPLYEIKVNDISVPITLNYSALGLKVGQEAGPAGMGWELSAGGKLITNMQGKRDGTNTGLYDELPTVASSGVMYPYTIGSHQLFMEGMLDGKKDGAWDTYNYILPNGGGTFTKNGLTFPYDPTITIPYVGQIKTTDGLIYDFMTGEQRKISKGNFYDASGHFVNTTYSPDAETIVSDQDLWRITSTKFKDSVLFSYEQTPFNQLWTRTRLTTSESLPLNRDIKARNTVNGGMIPNDPDSEWYQILEPIVSQTKTEVMSHTRVSLISFANGCVRFKYRTQDNLGRDVLDSIKIYQKVDNIEKLLKAYEFVYDSDMSKGHYLNAIRIYDGKLNPQGSWGFSYNSKLPIDPSVGSMGQDRWGFYNGATNNQSLLEHPDTVLALKNRLHYNIYNDGYKSPSKYIIYSRAENNLFYGISPPSQVMPGGKHYVNFANRKTTPTVISRGTLTGVKMPTGGRVSYEYEPHKFIYYYNGYDPRYETGGGIRIKSITKTMGHEALYNEFTPDTAKTLIKEYTYGNGTLDGGGSEINGWGTGTIPGNVMGNVSRYYDSQFPTTKYDVYNMMLLSHPVNSLSQLNGSSVVYTIVTELVKKNGASNGAYGKTVYYSQPVNPAYQPDALWKPTYAVPYGNPGLPLVTLTPGVEKAHSAGVMAVKKYASTGNPLFPYRILESRRSYFQSFEAPLDKKLVSLLASATGQICGAYPSSNVYTQNIAQTNPLGPGSVYLFDLFVSTGEVGQMDYLSANNILQESSTAVYPDKYAYNFVDLNTYSNCIRKTREEVTQWDDNELTLNLFNTNYYYDNPEHLLTTRVATTNSKGDSVITLTKYPQDYPYSYLGNMMDYMRTNKLGLNEPVEEYTLYKPGGFGSARYIKSGTINTFQLVDGSVMPERVYQMKVKNDRKAYTNTYYNGNLSSIDTNLFKQQVSYDYYVKGNIHKYTELSNPGNVVLWGYGNQYPIAKVNNSINVAADSQTGWYTSADVAYTSFEQSDKGNWTFSGAAVADITSPSGKKVYSLQSGAITKTNTTPSGQRYVISYWCKNGAAVTVTGGTLSAATVKNTWGDWTLAERVFSTVTGTVTVSGTGSIDELRFHPFYSQMSTYIYEPQIGITGVIDAKGALQNYDYDDSQRLRNIRDQRGNIVKSYRYKMGVSN